MKTKKKAGFGKTILKLLFVIPHLMSFTYHLTSLLASEAKLAGRSILVILVLSIFLSSILTTTWVCMLGMLLLYFNSLQWSWMASLLIVALVNIILLVVITLVISRVKRNLLFPATCQQIRDLTARE